MASVNDASVYMYHSKVRTMLKKAKSELIIKDNPYDTWKPEKSVCICCMMPCISWRLPILS